VASGKPWKFLCPCDECRPQRKRVAYTTVWKHTGQVPKEKVLCRCKRCGREGKEVAPSTLEKHRYEGPKPQNAVFLEPVLIGQREPSTSHTHEGSHGRDKPPFSTNHLNDDVLFMLYNALRMSAKACRKVHELNLPLAYRTRTNDEIRDLEHNIEQLEIARELARYWVGPSRAAILQAEIWVLKHQTRPSEYPGWEGDLKFAEDQLRTLPLQPQ